MSSVNKKALSETDIISKYIIPSIKQAGLDDMTHLAASPAFINLSLKEPRILDLVFAQSTGTANQANSSMVAIGNWLIPVPPLKEQNRIIEKLQVMLRTCDALTKSIKVEGGLQSKLADSVQLLN